MFTNNIGTSEMQNAECRMQNYFFPFYRFYPFFCGGKMVKTVNLAISYWPLAISSFALYRPPPLRSSP